MPSTLTNEGPFKIGILPLHSYSLVRGSLQMKLEEEGFCMLIFGPYH